MLKNDHGVALIIVLLVTALLIALVFEFAYSTRVSLRAAVNFRDSQRAYFLARSCENYFIKNKDFKKMLLRGDWFEVPLVSTGDTVVRIKWEDEQGKINIINMTQNDVAYNSVANLFEIVEISKDVLDKIVATGNPKIQLVTELHRYITDDDYIKVFPYLTANNYSGNTINLNTASEIVLRSTQPPEKVSEILKNQNQDKSSPINKVYCYATVGGYTKQIEAITNGVIFDYWKSL